MKIKSVNIILVSLATIIILAGLDRTAAQNESTYRFHELTIYTIPAPVEFDWSSPSTLLNSYKRGFIANFFKGGDYVLGHMFFKLTTPLLPEPVYKGMASASRAEQRKLVLSDKIGLGILGVGLGGRMETNEKLEQIIRKYSNRNKLAAITYRLSESSTKKILEFIDSFSSENENGHRPNLHYGGAFWPLFEDEGAGCSAFAVSLLELAGINHKKPDCWRVEIEIPMNLIGGMLNTSNHVSLKDIRSANQWYSGNGEPNISFVPFWIYDPTFVYNWIVEQLRNIGENKESLYKDATAYKLPRLFADVRDYEPEPGKEIFTKRNDQNIFISHFRQQNGLEDNPPAK